MDHSSIPYVKLERFGEQSGTPKAKIWERNGEQSGYNGKSALGEVPLRRESTSERIDTEIWLMK